MKKSPYQTREHLLRVPLDYLRPGGEQVEIFAREIFLPKNKDADVFVYLQGGPGFPGFREGDYMGFAAFKTLLKDFRVVQFDQRGTGRSGKIAPSLQKRSPAAQAGYFAQFRADNTVRDLEVLRKKKFGGKPWFLFGQSYGGFISLTYLSFQPEALKGVINTGGVAPLLATSVRAVYDPLVENLGRYNRGYFKRFPADRKQVAKIVAALERKPVAIGDGGTLTVDRFLDLGFYLGARSEATRLQKIHDLIEDPFTDSTGREVSWDFAKRVAQETSHWEMHFIYSVLHESIYCDGFSSNWAADAALKAHPGFDWRNGKINFYGETIRRGFFKEYGALKGFKDCAEILAKKKDWGRLYDLDQLSRNTVPVEAVIYENDMYVDRTLARETAKFTGGLRAWNNTKLQHGGVWDSKGEVMTTLLGRLMKRVKD